MHGGYENSGLEKLVAHQYGHRRYRRGWQKHTMAPQGGVHLTISLGLRIRQQPTLLRKMPWQNPALRSQRMTLASDHEQVVIKELFECDFTIGLRCGLAA